LTLWLLIAVDYSCTKGYLPTFAASDFDCYLCLQWLCIRTKLWIRSAQLVKLPKFGLFRGLIAPKLYVPHQNSRTKEHTHPTQFLAHAYCGQTAGWMKTPLDTEVDLGTGHIVLGMPTSPRNDSHHPQLCRLSCSCMTNTLPYPRVLYFGLFWDLENPLRRNSEIFHRVCMWKRSKSVQDKWLKGCVALITKNTFWHAGAEPLGRFPHFSCVSAHRGPSLTFQISSR